MEWFRENKIGIFVHYINIMFMLVVASNCYKISGFDYIYVTLIYMAAVFVYWFFSGVLHRTIQRLLVFIAVVGLLAFLGFTFKNKVIDFFYTDISGNIDSINNLLLKGQSTYFYQFKPVITVVLPIILFVLMFFYNNRMTEGVLLLGLLEMAFFWYLDYTNEVKKLIFSFILISVITYLMNNYKKTVYEFQKKGIYSSLNGRRLIRNIVLFSLLVGIIGVPMPQEIQGKDTMSIIERFENKYTKTAGNGVISGLDGAYGLVNSGYGDTEKKLGGPIALDRSIAFVVESDKPYYLKGGIKDEYTGNSWRNTVSNFNKLNEEGNSYVANLRSGYSALLMTPKEIKIYPEKLKSSSFMVPMYTDKIKDFKGDIFINEESSTFISSAKVSKEYTIEFYEVDRSRISDEHYGVYYINNEQYQKYLQLPETITERTVKLVYDLVKNCRNNEEKVEKLKDYLSQNYTYTLNASILPQGKDFVDYFLFEDKKGYCVHFASALSVMCRVAGIPTRFVEGYKMSSQAGTGTKQSVTNDMAHAWVEYLAADNIWDIADCSPTALENEQKQQNQQTSPINPNKPATSEPQKTNPNNPEEESTGGGSTSGKAKNTAAITKAVVYSAVISVSLVTLAAFIIVLLRKRKKILYGESLVPLHSYMQKRLKVYRIQKSSTETEKEFAIKQEEELRDILLPLSRKLYDEFYGGIKDNTIDKKKLYLKFEQFLKKRENKLKYYLKRAFNLL